MGRSMMVWAMAILLVCHTALGQESSDPPRFKPEELQQLVAPIALYPDDLLSQVLIASTYPLEVVAADRWVKDNGKLAPETRKAELQKQPWDSSVKSLTATPQVLATMSEKLDWTQKLGDAVLEQQAEVMDAVQALRSKAKANKTLLSTSQQTVETRTVESKEVIVIQPAAPQTVYVPVYDPNVAYGTWAYPAYPPVYYPPGYTAGSALMTGLFFGAGIALADSLWDDNDVDWGSGDINVNNNVNIHRGDRINRDRRPGEKWKHNPQHRRGVQYRDSAVQKKFNERAFSERENTRRDYRGREDAPTAGIRNTAKSRAEHNRSTASAKTKMTRRDASGVGKRNNNAFAGVGNGRATRAQADRGRASLGASNKRAAGGGRANGGRSGGGRKR